MKYALRHTLDIWSLPSSWAGLGAVYLLALVSGPFGTHMFHWPFFAIYWAVMLIVTFLAGTFVGSFFLNLVPPRPRAGHYLMISVATGWIIGHLIFGLDALMRGPEVTTAELHHEKGLLVILFSIIVSGAAFLLDASLRDFWNNRTPRLQARVGAPEGAELISISGDGRYVEVVTTHSSQRVLMRLADAIESASPVEGVMVHRSHWVALDHMTGRETVDGRDMLRTSDGRLLPVSRSGAASLEMFAPPDAETGA